MNSEVIYSGKDSIRFQKTHDKKKEQVKPKISGEKNVSTHTFRVYMVLRYESTPFVLSTRGGAVLSIFKVKIYSGTDNFQTTFRQLERHIYLSSCLFVVFNLSVPEYILTF